MKKKNKFASFVCFFLFYCFNRLFLSAMPKSFELRRVIVVGTAEIVWHIDGQKI